MAVRSVVLTSTGRQRVATDGDGRATLRYQARGLHVITAAAPGWRTVQAKVTVPLKNNSPVQVVILPVTGQTVERLETP